MTNKQDIKVTETKNSLSIDQIIAKKEGEIARLKAKKRKLENGQKIVMGGAILAEIKENKELAKTIIEVLERRLTRKIDIDRLAPIIVSIKKQMSEDIGHPNQ